MPDRPHALQNRCGDGEVIAEDQGFFTNNRTGPDYVRTARSVFFKAFTVPEGNEVIYTCDYIECWQAENCDGVSEENNKMLLRATIA